MNINLNCLNNNLQTIKDFTIRHKRELLIIGLALTALGMGIAASVWVEGGAVTLANKFFYTQVAMVQLAYGGVAPGWWGITAVTEAGNRFFQGVLTAVAGIAITSFSAGMYLR